MSWIKQVSQRSRPQSGGSRISANLGVWLVGLILALGCFPSAAALAQGSSAERQELRLDPGYVDFELFGFREGVEADVEVNLSGSLIKMLSSSFEDEEMDEVSTALSKIKSVRVRVFSLDGMDGQDVVVNARLEVKRLLDVGWEAIVRIKDDGEVIEILLRHDEDRVTGVFVLFVEDQDSVGLINIIGELDPAQLAKIGRQLQIGPLENLEEAFSQ